MTMQMTRNKSPCGSGNAVQPAGKEKVYPLIGIITPVHNRRQWTIPFAKMLDDQDYPIFKVYIVDSESSDGTPEELVKMNLSSIEVLEAPASAYWTAATNIGVKKALRDGCDYILTINDDAIVANTYISNIVEAVVQCKILICGSVISYASNPGLLWGVGAYNHWGSNAFLQLRMSNVWDDALRDISIEADLLISSDYLCGNGTIIHRSIFEEIGLYNEKYLPHYHADSEFTMRAEQAGIDRWVAIRARLFNRFSQIADGSFSPRNQKLFSLKSANYIPAILFVVDKYCPQHLKALSFVRYCACHFHKADWRKWSRLLRIVSFLVLSEQDRKASFRLFFPPLDEALCLSQDLEILIGLPHLELSIMLHGYLLRRPGSDNENFVRLGELDEGRSCLEIANEFVSSGEYAALSPCNVEFARALLSLRMMSGLDIDELHLSASQLWILKYIEREKCPPSGVEMRTWIAMEGTSLYVDNNLNPDVMEADAINQQAARTLVFMNVDVLCMAITDPRAATGVHRYVSNVVMQLSNSDRVDLYVFHADELASAAHELAKNGNALNKIRFAPSKVKQTEGIVFYPYFAFSSRDRRFDLLPEAVVIHDLFPLTNPEWFSSAAVSNFRHQLHSIVGSNHLFCDSKATESQLRAVLPGLRQSTSVAYPGVRRFVGVDAGKKSVGFSRRVSQAWRNSASDSYFLCVGTIEPRKNLKAAIEAMSLLQMEGIRNLKMVVVGQEGWNIDAHALYALAGSGHDKIQFLGRVPEEKLWALYEGALCTVFPSLAEGFGFPIVESMSCGTPVITSNASSMLELGSMGAILVDPQRPEEIASAIGKLARDSKLRAKLSKDAFEQAQVFTWKNCIDSLVKEFQRIENSSHG